MGDFLIDFGEKKECNTARVADLLQYYNDIHVDTVDFERFTLFLSRADDRDIWGPYQSIGEDIFVGLSGRIALESEEWESVKEMRGEGGLACKAIFKKYRSGGIKNLENLNGNFVVLVIDGTIQKLYIVTDRCGMFPCYMARSNNGDTVLCSHPDILAKVSEISDDWDMTSMAEFIITGKVTFPNSYYKNVKALDFGSIYSVDLGDGNATFEGKRKYFEFDYRIDTRLSEWELAEELSVSVRNAINRRILPIFGQTAISLSGGLDSRTLLCSAEPMDDIWTFTFFDEENLEFRISRNIAEDAGVHFIPLRRNFDHYGDGAESGVRISGGMGDFGSNHYLGFRDRFQQLGIDNIISGFYFDYLFKGLELDTRKNKLMRTEKLAFEFKYLNYMPLFWFETKYAKYVLERLDSLFPDGVKCDFSDLGRLKMEERRLFPLFSEPDHQETLIPQRVLGWYLPIVDNDIIDTYLKVPPQHKVNTSMYSKMVEIQCGEKISEIPNVNTGTRVNASRLNILLSSYKRALEKRLTVKKNSMASEGSWPNWPYYIYNSKRIESLWMRKNNTAKELFMQIMGENHYRKNVREYRGSELKLFLRLFTLKLWLDQRELLR